jgi:TolA-binding protein
MTVVARCDAKEVYPGELAPCIITVRNEGDSTIHYLPERVVWEIRYSGPGGKTATEPAGPWRREGAEEGFAPEFLMHLRAGKYFRTETYFEARIHGKSLPGHYITQWMIWSEGKATVTDTQLDQLKKAMEQPWSEQDKDNRQEDDTEEPRGTRLIQIDCWKGKVCATPLGLELKELTSADDKAAYDLLRSGQTINWTVPSGRNVLAMRQVLEKYPKSVYAKDCAWYLAEHAYQSNRKVGKGWRRAVPLYQKVIEDYPAFQFTDDAKLRLAQICLADPEAGGEAKARGMLEDILKNHAQSTSADEAKEMLVLLEAKGKAATSKVGHADFQPTAGNLRAE